MHPNHAEEKKKHFMMLSKASTPTQRLPKPIEPTQKEEKWTATSTGRQVFGTNISWPKFKLDEPVINGFMRCVLHTVNT